VKIGNEYQNQEGTQNFLTPKCIHKVNAGNTLRKIKRIEK